MRVSYKKRSSKLCIADGAVFGEFKARFLQQMGNDLNTSMAITVLYDVLKAQTGDGTKLALIQDFDEVLSLSLLQQAEAYRKARDDADTTVSQGADPEIEALAAARTNAKKEKNFGEADRIRDELKARGIEIIDTPKGSQWKRI